MDFENASIDEIIEHQGWSDSTQLDLLREYITNQGDDDALRDFLRRKAEEENAG